MLVRRYVLIHAAVHAPYLQDRLSTPTSPAAHRKGCSIYHRLVRQFAGRWDLPPPWGEEPLDYCLLHTAEFEYSTINDTFLRGNRVLKNDSRSLMPRSKASNRTVCEHLRNADDQIFAAAYWSVCSSTLRRGGAYDNDAVGGGVGLQCVCSTLKIHSHGSVVNTQHSPHRLADFHVIRNLHSVHHPLRRKSSLLLRQVLGCR